MKPDVVILLMTYNHAWCLPACLDSLLAQTYKNFHLLIVDDGSKDNSFAIAKSYESKFQNCTVLRNEQNKGVISNYHYCLQLIEQNMPSADFFLWNCPDDAWSPAYVEKTRAALLENPGASASQTYFEMKYLKDGHVSRRQLVSIPDCSYASGKKLFRAHVTEEGRAYYNNMLHGMMRMADLRVVYPDDRTKLAMALATEISLLVALLMRGSFIIVPETLFHKQTSGAFADLHPNDELSGYHRNIFTRAKAVFTRLPQLMTIRPRTCSSFTVFLLWLWLFYPYLLIPLYKRIRSKK